LLKTHLQVSSIEDHRRPIQALRRGHYLRLEHLIIKIGEVPSLDWAPLVHLGLSQLSKMLVETRPTRHPSAMQTSLADSILEHGAQMVLKYHMFFQPANFLLFIAQAPF